MPPLMLSASTTAAVVRAAVSSASWSASLRAPQLSMAVVARRLRRVTAVGEMSARHAVHLAAPSGAEQALR